MTYYVLIIRLANNVRIKVLETKNAKKIRKELICVRKFLGLEDGELAIFDETRQKEGTKEENRFQGKPRKSQLINSQGEAVYEEEFPGGEIEIVDVPPESVETTESTFRDKDD